MATKKAKKTATKPKKKGKGPGKALAVAKPQAVELHQLKVVELKIISASLKDKRLNVAYIKGFEGFKANNVVEECQNEVHPDLITLFNKLKPHYVLINDYRESVKNGKEINIDDFSSDELENIKVTGFHLKGEGEKRSIILIGQKKMNNRVLCANTPNLKFEDASNPYEHIEHLNDLLVEIDKEILDYFNGKFSPNVQQEIVFEGEEAAQEEAVEETEE